VEAVAARVVCGQGGFCGPADELIGKALESRRRDSHSGPAREAHDEKAAEELLGQGLRALGVEGTELKGLAKGAVEKAALAWLLRERTTVGLSWIAGRLEMGHESRVSQAVLRMRRRPGRRLKRCQQLLNAMGRNEKSK
jgi:hypothetical protein